MVVTNQEFFDKAGVASLIVNGITVLQDAPILDVITEGCDCMLAAVLECDLPFVEVDFGKGHKELGEYLTLLEDNGIIKMA